MITRRRWTVIAQGALRLVREMAPFRTGNLRYNAIKLEMRRGGFSIQVDESIAPYMPYTNEVWEQKLIRMGNFIKGQTVERMRTWRNPNQGWWNQAARAVAVYISEQIGGELNND